MIQINPGRCVQFIDPTTEGWQIGRVMTDDGDELICRNDDLRLVRTNPGGREVIVHKGLLAEYPSEPISEPTNLGRAG